MNIYCKYTLNQIWIAVTTTLALMDKLEETDLRKRPSSNKHSIGELLEHIAIICEADALISDGITQEEMQQYYSMNSYKNLSEIKATLIQNYQILEAKFMAFTEAELHEKITSFWGVTYTRYEWLVEIVAHIYHHRGQLHSMLVHCYKKDLKVPLFE
ncbi:DinB family protein [Sporosarcina sp. JAI121]|uniref:DinB family protein n=1 Tax=Sporosarcina sp. JAI121 TaxID=2723064 RepID=UPI0015C873C1|nr:DinB family protein [Sporosarcina sp. JAI121]NYF24687.1 putative damage-inducible protein DinB [Sporosarcina sp. JAI121]